MPKSPQDVYARHLISPRGYPLWTPEPSHQFVVYRRDGLKIGDVGVVIPEDGYFDVFFNICLPQDHHFHRATGVPDNFKRIELSDMDIRTVVSAENPGRIIANSSVRSVRTIERPADSSSERTRPSGLEYEFTLSSSEGALLILPEGAERHDLRNHHRFLEVATQHGADWYRFAEEKVGQIIDNDSLYLITGLHKTRSWSVAAFEKTAGTAEHSAQFRVSQSGSDSIAATYTWDTTRALDWRVGPVDNYGLANQSVFIRGFKVALRTGIFGTKWISVKADAPSTRPNPARSLGAVGGDSLFAYVFSSTGKTTQSSGSGVQDEVAANSALDDARNEIQNSGALAVGEHVVIQRIPEASQAFHPSDIINRYLLDKEPSANIAITHDDDWITILEENLLQPEDLVQEGRLETLVSQKYDTISDEGAVYLRSRSGSGTFNADDADSTMEGREIHSEERNATVIDTVQVRERGFSSTRRSSVELLPVPDLSHQRIFPGQGATGSTYNITHTTSPMQEAQARIVADIRQTLNLNNYQQGLPPRSTVATNETSRAPDLPRPHCSELDHPASLADSNSIGATEAPGVDHTHLQPLLNRGASKPQTLTNHAEPTHTGVVIPAPLFLPHDVERPTVLPPPAPFKCGSSSTNMAGHCIIDPFIKSKHNMFALIIGIDDYFNCGKLRGAVSDAKAMKEYLEQVLRVPEDHIRTLFDQNATRNAIIQAFKDLQKDERIEKGNPIVVFYAGHGGELPSPVSWTWWDPKSMIQCLLPQDYDKSCIPPIPDRAVGALIEGIAKAKGDNITVIFDCCHSASMTRGDNDVYVPRTVKLDYTIPDDLDQDIWGDRAGKIHPKFAYHGLQSHVLLAACGEDGCAYEYEGRGRFTAAILETLKNCAIDNITYTEVLEHIHLDQQNPHCEGVNQHRILFDPRVPAGRQVRHSVCIKDGGKCVIGAGLAHGVTYGVEFTLYKQKRSLGVVVVHDAAEIEDFQTTVTTSLRLTDASFAKLTRVGNLPLYPTPGGNLSSVLEEVNRRMDVNGTNAPNFWLVEEAKAAKLEVAIENDLAVLKVLDRRLKRFGLTDLSFRIALERLTHALGAAAHYYWYLDLTKENNLIDTNDGMTVDFYLLQESESEYDEYGMPLLIPVKPGFCRRDPNVETSDVIDFVVDPNGVYGIKITNKTTRDLYLNAFLFNNSSLSIAPYYTQPSASTPKAPLKQNASFIIGYGTAGTAPFAYSLEEGQDVDVGYLKIFFATRPIDLADIVQPSPFSTENARSRIDEGGRKARMNALPLVQPSEPNDTWFTYVIPVVQRRSKMPAV